MPGQPLPGETPTQHLLREAYQANKEAQEKGHFVDVPEKQISACPLCQKSMRIEDIDHHIQFYCKAEEEKSAQKRKVQEEAHRRAEQEAKRARDLAERERAERTRKAREEEERKERERETQAAAAAAAVAEARDKLAREQAQAERELGEQKRLAEEERKRREARSHGPSALVSQILRSKPCLRETKPFQEVAMAKALERDEQKRRAQTSKTGQDATNWEQQALEEQRVQQQRQREEETRLEQEQRQAEQADLARKVCKFFLTKKGCRLGDACPNFHDTELLEQRAQLPPPAARAQPSQEDLDILATVVSLLKAQGGEVRLNQLGSRLPPALKASNTLQKMKLKTFLLDYPELFSLPPSDPGYDTVVLVTQNQYQPQPQPQQPPPARADKSPPVAQRASLPSGTPAAFASVSSAFAAPSYSPPAAAEPAFDSRPRLQLHFSTSSQIVERLLGSERSELGTMLANLAGSSLDELAISIESHPHGFSTVTLLVPDTRAQWVKSTLEEHLARANGGQLVSVGVRSAPISSFVNATALSPPGLGSASAAQSPTSSAPTGPQLLRLQFTIEASVAGELFGDVNSVLRKTLANLASVLPSVLKVQIVPRGLLSHVSICLPDTGNAWLAAAAVRMLEEALRRVAASTATITTDHVDATNTTVSSTSNPETAPVVAPPAPAAAPARPMPSPLPAKHELEELNQLPISLSDSEDEDDNLPAYSPFSGGPGQWVPYEATNGSASASSFFGNAAPATAPRWLATPGASMEPWTPPQFGGFFSQPPLPSSPSFAAPFALSTQPPPTSPSLASPFFALPPAPAPGPENLHAPFGPGFLPGTGFFGGGHSFYPPQEYPTNNNATQNNGSGENRDETNNYGQLGPFYWNPVDQSTRQ